MTSSTSESTSVVRYIAFKLGSDATWAQRAIVVLYAHQTADEQESNSTRERNGAGFNGTDAFILSSFAEQIGRGRNLSSKQLAIAFRKLPKYSRQIQRTISSERMESLIPVALKWAEANPPAIKVVTERVVCNNTLSSLI